MLDWAIDFAQRHQWLLIGLSLLSVVSAITTLTLGVRLIARLPRDYFVNDERHQITLTGYPLLVRLGLPFVKNLLGLVFVISGIAMLVLPGQGLLTLLAGLLLMNFPGKFALERWLVRRARVRDAINWLRHRAGQPALILDRDEMP